MENYEKKAYLYAEKLRRLSNQKFWEEYKKIFGYKNLNELGIDIYEKLEDYHAVLNTKVKTAMDKALNTKSTTELNLIRAELETVNPTISKLRFLLTSEEQTINGMLKGIDRMLKNFGEKPEHVFYHPKTEKVIENVVCPFCYKTNKNFQYDMPCQFCQEQIGDPWKEHTICPKCSSVINPTTKHNGT